MGKPDAGNPPVRFDEGDQVLGLVPTLPPGAKRRFSAFCGVFAERPVLDASIRLEVRYLDACGQQ